MDKANASVAIYGDETQRWAIQETSDKYGSTLAIFIHIWELTLILRPFRSAPTEVFLLTSCCNSVTQRGMLPTGVLGQTCRACGEPTLSATSPADGEYVGQWLAEGGLESWLSPLAPSVLKSIPEAYHLQHVLEQWSEDYRARQGWDQIGFPLIESKRLAGVNFTPLTRSAPAKSGPGHGG